MNADYQIKQECLSGRGMAATLLTAMIALSALSGLRAQTGVYTLNGGTASQTGQTYAATLADQSAVYVLNSGQLTLTNCIMTKTGDASNVNNSSQYGTNAGVLATTAGKITISGGSVTTDASGGNGLFATGTNSSVSMTNGTISASGGNAHGIDVTYGGSITLNNVNVTTTGASSSALATDFGGGTVSVTGGIIQAASTAANSHSAGIYSTGSITVTGASVSSAGDCGGVIDGANSITLVNTSLSGSVEGIKLWKTAPASGSATVSINGGTLGSSAGDAFYVTGETGNTASGNISVSGGAVITAGTGNIVKAVSPASVNFTATGESLQGNFITSGSSTISASLAGNSSLSGMINAAALTIDASSSWVLTGNSIVTTITDPSGISGLSVTNITGNGFSVHYDATLSGNSYLGGLTYSLVNGGYLTPGYVPVGIEETAGSGTHLLQNYPNPFVTGTTVSYFLESASQTRLTVTDMLGRTLAVIAGGNMEAGSHSAEFDGSALNPGIYYCVLESGDTRKIVKMIKAR